MHRGDRVGCLAALLDRAKVVDGGEAQPGDDLEICDSERIEPIGAEQRAPSNAAAEPGGIATQVPDVVSTVERNVATGHRRALHVSSVRRRHRADNAQNVTSG